VSQPADANSPDFEALLDYIRSSRGFDFSGYKRNTLSRRFNKRMGEVGVSNYGDYQDYLQVDPEEFDRLFNTLLINVTSFFRDPEAWLVMCNQVIPDIVDRKARGDSIRCWSVGCASGEEAYTLAIALAEHLGIDRFCHQVKIYATDVDQEALQEARHATYSPKSLEPLTSEQIQKYFVPIEENYVFRRDMRRRVIFGRHDLVQDAPISKIDLLICRNTLMYFNSETQRKVLARFRFALKERGFIFLGKAEMLLVYTDVFEPVDLKHRIFRKLISPETQNRFLLTSSGHGEAIDEAQPTQQALLRDAAFDRGTVACLVVNQSGALAMVNAVARDLFGVTKQDVGRPLQDLEVSYRPLELRSRIQESLNQRNDVIVRDVQWHTLRNEQIYFDVQFHALIEEGAILGVSITFTDVTRYKRLRKELEDSKQELEVANEELQSTNEELETTNEELQSSNEELETTNEELQSTNEELETMNEELQSTNEELQTVNDELQNSSEQLNRSNAFLEAILASLKRGVVVIDRDLIIQAWNNRAEDLWGIRIDEAVGQHLLNLDIGLPLDELRTPIRDCLAADDSHFSEFTLDAVNRRGRSIQCRISCTPLVNVVGSDIAGVILLMEEMIEEVELAQDE